jgi:hypothetical protein
VTITPAGANTIVRISGGSFVIWANPFAIEDVNQAS